MKKIIPAIFLMTFTGIFISCNNKSKPRVLVFSKTMVYRHSSIPNGIAAIKKLGLENGFEADSTEDARRFNDDTLKKYAAVIFLNTTGNVLDNKEEIAFERFIQAGGGFVGIHSATDTEYDWGWYGDLVGAYFVDHPSIQKATLMVVDSAHPSTRNLPAVWNRTDEWYNFRNLNKDVKVLLKIDEKSYSGGTMGGDHPMAWYHDFDGGRSFYTELGHREENYTDSLYLKHILGGIEYAVGNDQLDYTKVKSVYRPDDSHFTKTVLSKGAFFEPTEMTILPNLDVLVIQRRGEILLYKNDSKKIKKAGFLNVYWKSKDTTVNAEEGLLGVCKDPDFSENNWVYIFYSPADISVNRLSRFTLKNDTIDNASEKIILQFYSQREICCHTGGSVAFGPGNLLYLSTGDNSTPFDEPKQRYVSNGFAPLDERLHHEKYDAERSAGNSNDLRGKIIRIKINSDGSYAIPDGNLFPKNEPKTRAEIYIMGDRNPYRISVDQKNSYLYWGEVGPDAPKDSFDTRGPKGYDEINQARKAGYFGWPFFVGDNFAYHSYDYATGKHGPAFDINKPINNSRNNTGIRELPAAQAAFIWYPYDSSAIFPEMGAGGRTAMAGPVYYPDLYPEATRLPDYYNGKLFIYDWMRNFIKVVTMRPNGDFYKMEPFIEKMKLASPIDMEMGPDGRLYILEYGTGWFSKNPDSGLSRIDFTN
jgi:glucose/arabinose dehydrogenase